MKTRSFKLAMALAFIATFLFAFAACGNDDNDSRLHGSWVSTVNDFTYQLNADGTGTRGIPGAMEQITWSTENNNTFIVTVGVAEERWSYRIRSGNVYFTHSAVPGYEYPFTRP